MTKVLSVSGLSKKFASDLRKSLAYGVTDIAREIVARPRLGDLRKGEFWALDDVSFEVSAGESLAIVGNNGAGKSTLLKILYGLLKPDRGEVRMHGRTEAIIELGLGFNEVLTARENIEISAVLNRLSAQQARELLDFVVDFAELGSFLEAPVQSFSSGMRARLSYAISAYLKPDLLLIDEVLAVGDLAFQHKCVSHMRQYLAGGGALLFVSHNTHQIQAVCTRGLLLENGRAIFDGPAVGALAASFDRRRVSEPQAADVLISSGPVRIERLETDGGDENRVLSGEDVQINVLYDADHAVDVIWGFNIWTDDQWVCVAGGSDQEPRRIGPGKGTLSATIRGLPLVGGRYAVQAGILEAGSACTLATKGVFDGAMRLTVVDQLTAATNVEIATGQLIHLPITWR